LAFDILSKRMIQAGMLIALVVDGLDMAIILLGTT
jgi:hypothetical protein